jgi:FHS family glucose/mannose:H+ symporter-like MFS transporter
MTDGQNRTLNVVLHFVFFLSGIATVLIGQVLPVLAGKFELNDLQSGYFFPAQFAGSLTGTLLTNWFGRKGKLVLASAIGSALMASGMLMLNLGSYDLVLAAFLVNGLGVGLTLPAINVLILERDPEVSASALAFLNFFWGVGAIVCKPFVDLSARGESLWLTTGLIFAPLVFAAALLLILPSQTEARVESPAEGESHYPIWSTPMAWAIAAFNFIHVGFESGMGGWLTTYTNRVEGGTGIHLISPTFLFFLFFVVGRGVAPFFFRFINENRMLLASLTMILIGLVIALSADGIFQLGVGASLSGLGTSSVFPTNISRFSKVFGAGAMRRATPLFIAGTLGATVITWLIGFLSNTTGSIRSGMFVLIVSVTLLLALQLLLALKGAVGFGDPACSEIAGRKTVD